MTMFKSTALFAASLLSLSSMASLAKADSELNQARAILAARAAFSGTFDEGEAEIRKRKCGPLGTQSGKYERYLTYPGAARVSLSQEFDGTVQVPFNCRVRTRQVAGCGGFQESTGDTQAAGYVQVRVSIGRNNKISFLSDVQKVGGAGRCGDSMVARINTLRGQTVIFR